MHPNDCNWPCQTSHLMYVLTVVCWDIATNFVFEHVCIQLLLYRIDMPWTYTNNQNTHNTCFFTIFLLNTTSSYNAVNQLFPMYFCLWTWYIIAFYQQKRCCHILPQNQLIPNFLINIHTYLHSYSQTQISTWSYAILRYLCIYIRQKWCPYKTFLILLILQCCMLISADLTAFL